MPAGRKRERRSVDEFCEHYGYERKYAIKLLGAGLNRGWWNGSGRGPSEYEPVVEVVERIWTHAEQLCGKRLAPALELWLPHYGRHYGQLLPRRRGFWRLSAGNAGPDVGQPQSPEATRAPAPRVRARFCASKCPFKVRCGMRGGWAFWRRTAWPIVAAALREASLNSLTYTDLACTWTEGPAVWNKGSEGVLAQTRDVEQKLPFPHSGL